MGVSTWLLQPQPVVLARGRRLPENATGNGTAVRERRGLPRVFDQSQVADWFYLSSVSVQGWVGRSAESLDLPELSPTVHRNRRDNIRGNSPAFADVVSCSLVSDQPKIWGERIGSAAGFGTRQLRNSMDLAPQASPRHGSAWSGSPQGNC